MLRADMAFGQWLTSFSGAAQATLAGSKSFKELCLSHALPASQPEVVKNLLPFGVCGFRALPLKARHNPCIYSAVFTWKEAL